jgi:hypothetical protein
VKQDQAEGKAGDKYVYKDDQNGLVEVRGPHLMGAMGLLPRIEQDPDAEAEPHDYKGQHSRYEPEKEPIVSFGNAVIEPNTVVVEAL